MALISINWKPDAKELRSFGKSILIGCAIFAALFLVLHHFYPVRFARGPVISLVFCALGIVTWLLGNTGTRAALPIYLVWMGIAFVMGSIISRVLISLFYYLMITPMGLVMRLSGRDKLNIRKQDTKTYWVDSKPLPENYSYERQF